MCSLRFVLNVFVFDLHFAFYDFVYNFRLLMGRLMLMLMLCGWKSSDGNAIEGTNRSTKALISYKVSETKCIHNYCATYDDFFKHFS
jgi:hypothetical protein